MCVCVFDSLSVQEDLGSDPNTSDKVQPWARVSHSTTQKFQLLVATRGPHACYRAISGATMTEDVDELAQELAKVRDQDRVLRMGV